MNMKKKISARMARLKDKLDRYYKSPASIIADIIFYSYGRELSKVPFPVLYFVIRHCGGGWAGVSIFYASREFSYKYRIEKFRKFSFLFFIPPIITLIYYSAIQDSENFMYGFSQNLLSDIILIIIVIYILPRYLNQHKEYGVVINQKPNIYNIRPGTNKKEILLTIKNIGDEVYKPGEIFWQIYITLNCFEEEDIIYHQGTATINKSILGENWEFIGYNTNSLFNNQETIIAKIKFLESKLNGSKRGPLKIYYQMFTVGGNLPLLEDITSDFQNAGIPFDELPKVGEIEFRDWYHPAKSA